MKTDSNNQGIVYVLTNQAIQGMVKIGMTTRNNMDERMRELFSTGVPVPFECAFACTVPASTCSKIEKALHKAFAPNRVHASREFFKINPDQAIAILDLFDNKREITEEVNREIDDDLTGEDKASRENLKRQKRPNLNFIEMGIPVGSVITFGHEPEAMDAIISNDKRVRYEGEEYTLTALTRKLKNLDYSVAPTPHWYFNGKSLADIYEETYPFAED
ncbi:MAG: GIY-YIG nuclease family protein [Tannerellaceae bacterium]|jgi:hypothetical protein|nr:GIY-YIG nuclease family protein [Tannerellaceae bacterium]